MNSWGYRLMQFMRGRYGFDQFGVFLMIFSFIIEIIGNIIRIRYVYWAGLALFFYAVFRIFSRNIYKRQNENMRYMRFRSRFGRKRYYGDRQGGYQGSAQWDQQSRQAWKQQGRRRKDKTVYCYYNCPSCMQQVRVPAGKGKVRITCPKCGSTFETMS